MTKTGQFKSSSKTDAEGAEKGLGATRHLDPGCRPCREEIKVWGIFLILVCKYFHRCELLYPLTTAQSLRKMQREHRGSMSPKINDFGWRHLLKSSAM